MILFNNKFKSILAILDSIYALLLILFITSVAIYFVGNLASYAITGKTFTFIGMFKWVIDFIDNLRVW